MMAEMVNSVDIETSGFPFDPLIVDAPLSHPKETQPVLRDASDESVFDAMIDLIRKDPKYKSGGNRKSVRLRGKEGASFRIRITEHDVRREWLERLVRRGDAFQARITDKGIEYDALDDKPGQPTIGVTKDIEEFQHGLERVRLDIETLDHLIFPEHRFHLVKHGYPDLQERVAKKTNRSEEVLKGAAELRQEFFGERSVPVWMNNTAIAARVVRK